MGTINTPNIQILVALTCFLVFLFHYVKNMHKKSAITNWPVVGMLPGLLFNMNHIHEYFTRVLTEIGGTLEFKGPWFLNLDFVLTCDPMNIDHIFSKSFPIYQKGPEFKHTFDMLGDGILAVDSDLWAFQRKMILRYFRDGDFQLFLERTIQDKIAKSLYPILDHACMQETEVNMEDVIQRLGFDVVCLLVLGCDPECLSMDFPEVTYERALSEGEEVLMNRNVVPAKYWKLMRWLQWGGEKKLTAAVKAFDGFAYQCIESKRKKLVSGEVEASHDFLTTYLSGELANEESVPTNVSNPDKFLRDMIVSLVVAGRDTSSAALSWFFWLLAKNPFVENKILEEINELLDLQTTKEGGMRSDFSMHELNRLVYLHATLCETLRFYPSLPFNHKVAMQRDTLPSGHKVEALTKFYISYYALGRMEGIWGKDCMEFKPERWISKNKEIVHVPSYKFSVFGAGQRQCLGKDVSFVQMKIAAVAILVKYKLEIVEDHPVEPASSSILHMKHGLKVRIKKRCLV